LSKQNLIKINAKPSESRQENSSFPFKPHYRSLMPMHREREKNKDRKKKEKKSRV
jgi:hypothetical protein